MFNNKTIIIFFVLIIFYCRKGRNDLSTWSVIVSVLVDLTEDTFLEKY